MRIMQYQANLDMYIISNGGSKQGSKKKAPIRITSYGGLEDKTRQGIYYDESLADVYEDLLAGRRPDYALTSVDVQENGCALHFISYIEGVDGGGIYAYNIDNLNVKLEVNRENRKMFDTYTISTSVVECPDELFFPNRLRYFTKIIEQHGERKRTLEFKDDAACSDVLITDEYC